MQLGEGPHTKILTKSRGKYGDMFQTKLGSMPVVVLNDIDTFKQALEIQGESAVGRSDLYSFSLTENEGSSVICNLCFGKRYNQNDKEFLTVLQAYYKVILCNMQYNSHNGKNQHVLTTDWKKRVILNIRA
nr:PREDICTED: cytochrome P450 1A1-like [Phalacrocorax carbo]